MGRAEAAAGLFVCVYACYAALAFHRRVRRLEADLRRLRETTGAAQQLQAHRRPRDYSRPAPPPPRLVPPADGINLVPPANGLSLISRGTSAAANEGIKRQDVELLPNLFEQLPHEAFERILEALPTVGQLQCERVCTEWREAIAMLPLWPAWRQQQARLIETPITLPGVPVPSFSTPPVDILAADTALTEEAHATAASISTERLQLGVSGMHWTVFSMTRSGAVAYKPLRQLTVNDFLLATSPCGQWVASGDKDGQLRLWCARSGALLHRFGFGGSVSALELCAATGLSLLIADSTGQLFLIPHLDVASSTSSSSAAAASGGDGDAGRVSRQRCIAWRAHEGKALCLRGRALASHVVSGGTDGVVRRWPVDRLLRLAAEAASPTATFAHDTPPPPPPSSSPPPGEGEGEGICATTTMLRGAVRSMPMVELGLLACAEAVVAGSHRDSVILAEHDASYVVSASRHGAVHIHDAASGVRLLALPAQGHVNCLALHRGRLIVCVDDGQQATLIFYDVPRCSAEGSVACVQRIGGLRKYHAPSTFSYVGCDAAMWVRDSTLCLVAWDDPQQAEQQPVAQLQ